MLQYPDIRPGFAPRMVFRLDGVRRDPGEAAVLDPKWRDAFVGMLPWSLKLARSAIRLPSPLVELPSGRITHRRDTEAWLRLLRPLLLKARGCPGFVLCTITRVDVSPTRIRLFGTCAPFMSDVPDSGHRSDVTRH